MRIRILDLCLSNLRVLFKVRPDPENFYLIVSLTHHTSGELFDCHRVLYDITNLKVMKNPITIKKILRCASYRAKNGPNTFMVIGNRIHKASPECFGRDFRWYRSMAAREKRVS